MNLYSVNALADCRYKKTRFFAIAVAVTVCRCAAWRGVGVFSSFVRVVFFSSVIAYVILFVLYLFLVLYLVYYLVLF